MIGRVPDTANPSLLREVLHPRLTGATDSRFLLAGVNFPGLSIDSCSSFVLMYRCLDGLIRDLLRI